MDLGYESADGVALFWDVAEGAPGNVVPALAQLLRKLARPRRILVADGARDAYTITGRVGASTPGTALTTSQT